MLHHRLRAVPVAPVTFAFVAWATSSASSITIPSGAQAGDLAVLLDRSGGLGIPSTVVPSGWTSISTVSISAGGLGVKQILSYRALSSAGGGSITGMNSISNSKVMLVLRPSTAQSYAVASINDHTPQNTAPSTQTVTAQTLPYVIVAGFGTTGTPTMPGSWFAASQVSNKLILAYALPTSSSDVTITANDQGDSNTLQSCAILGS